LQVRRLPTRARAGLRDPRGARARRADDARFSSYRKLQRELAHEERRRDPQAMAASRQDNRRVFRARNRANRKNPKIG
jgi:hypothetical protein